MRRAASVLAGTTLVLLLALPAWSQSTGGSFGGGSFSSGGSSGGSSYSSSGSSSYSSGSSSGSSWGGSSSGYSSSSRGGSSSYGYGGGDCSGGAAMIFVMVIFLGVIVGLAGVTRSNRLRVPTGLSSDDSPDLEPEMHGSVLQLGIDWHAREELQEALARLAASGDTATAQGRARLLSETVIALLRVKISWLYVGYRELGWAPPAAAEAAFKRAGSDARSRFRRELIRNADGEQVTADAPADLTARSEEGPGLVVVTLIVVARKALSGVESVNDAGTIRAALEDRGALSAGELVALEVAWSPAAEEDRMSSAELQAHYPELVLIDPATIAGRAMCEYCGGAFAMELLTCPHCAAPVKKPAPA